MIANDAVRDVEWKAEKEQNIKYYQLKREAKQLEEKLLEKEKQERFKKRGERNVKHYGRVIPHRSEKPAVKKTEKVCELSEMERDYRMYLDDIAQILLDSQKPGGMDNHTTDKK